MALRNLRTVGDEILTKRAREIKENSEKIQTLIDDMFETMYHENGVGLAAPQIGVLKRVFVIDCSTDKSEAFALINPEIIETSGEQTGVEGCLSVPGKAGIVKRPNYVKARGLDRNFKEIVVEGEGLLARALAHETDHLNGHLYTEKVIGKVYRTGDSDAEEEAKKIAGIE